jgi:hypothetical protein
MSTGTLLKNLRPADGTGEAGQGSPGEPQRRTRYGALLAVLLASYVLSAFIQEKWVAAVQIALFLGASLIAFRAENIRRGAARLLVGVIVAGSAVAVTLALNHSGLDSGLAYSWSAFILLLAVLVIVRRVVALPEVTLQSIFGAVSAYMIIGLMFAAIYEAINQFTASSFFAQGPVASLKTFQYFSFTTLTTLGYGDYTAAQSGGQAVAAMEAVVGQIFLATLVARLVSAFRGNGVRRQAGAAAQAGPAEAAGPGNQAGLAQPASPGRDPARGETAGHLSPRARARQARRARLRLG